MKMDKKFKRFSLHIMNCNYSLSHRGIDNFHFKTSWQLYTGVKYSKPWKSHWNEQHLKKQPCICLLRKGNWQKCGKIKNSAVTLLQYLNMCSFSSEEKEHLFKHFDFSHQCNLSFCVTFHREEKYFEWIFRVSYKKIWASLPEYLSQSDALQPSSLKHVWIHEKF